MATGAAAWLRRSTAGLLALQYAKPVLVTLVIVLGVRALLPLGLAAVADHVLDQGDALDGSVRDVDLALWRGAARFEGLTLRSRSDAVRDPLLDVDRIDASLDWSALLRGALLVDLRVVGARYDLVAAPEESPDVLLHLEEQLQLGERLAELVPMRVDHFVLLGGRVRFRDPHREPRVAIEIDQIEVLGRRLGDTRRSGERRYASVVARARVFESGRLAFGMRLDPLAGRPDFGLDLLVKDIDLRELNDLLRAYAALDVSRGRLDVYAELEGRDGRFEGYVKPLVRGLDVVDDESKSLLANAWEGLVGTLAELFENQPEDQQAARIPIEGEFEDPDIEVWAAVASVLHNAFVEALPKGLEGAQP